MKEFLASFWGAIIEHPRTTAGAVAGIAASCAGAYKDPNLLVSPEWWAVLFVALSLLAASDAKKGQQA